MSVIDNTYGCWGTASESVSFTVADSLSSSSDVIIPVSGVSRPCHLAGVVASEFFVNQKVSVRSIDVSAHRNSTSSYLDAEKPSLLSVTLRVGSVSCNATTNASGAASCSIGASALGSGSYSVSATFAGDVNIAGSTSSNALTFGVTTKPVFTSINSTSAVVSHFLSFQVSATGNPTPTFSASGLPSGVSISSSGVLSGSVSKIGKPTPSPSAPQVLPA